jgi:hypothetical protein
MSSKIKLIAECSQGTRETCNKPFRYLALDSAHGGRECRSNQHNARRNVHICDR